MAIIEGVFSSLIAESISTGFRHREQIHKRVMWSILKRDTTIRISCSCLFKFEINGKYLLIRNILRRDQFGPIGGVIKHYDSAKSFLDTIDYEADTHNKKEFRAKIKRDLRGFIPAKNLFKFVKWYVSRKDREENSLHREIKEEFDEIGIKHLLSDLSDFEFSKIRKISEGPHKVAGKDFQQFRILTIYELSSNYADKQKFLDLLENEIPKNENLILVDSNEILTRFKQVFHTKVIQSELILHLLLVKENSLKRIDHGLTKSKKNHIFKRHCEKKWC